MLYNVYMDFYDGSKGKKEGLEWSSIQDFLLHWVASVGIHCDLCKTESSNIKRITIEEIS